MILRWCSSFGLGFNDGRAHLWRGREGIWLLPPGATDHFWRRRRLGQLRDKYVLPDVALLRNKGLVFRFLSLLRLVLKIYRSLDGGGEPIPITEAERV
jgi:hypothetical protein